MSASEEWSCLKVLCVPLSPGPWPRPKQELRFYSGAHTEGRHSTGGGVVQAAWGRMWCGSSAGYGEASSLVLVDAVAGAFACCLLRHGRLENAVLSGGSPQRGSPLPPAPAPSTEGSLRTVAVAGVLTDGHSLHAHEWSRGPPHLLAAARLRGGWCR